MTLTTSNTNLFYQNRTQLNLFSPPSAFISRVPRFQIQSVNPHRKINAQIHTWILNPTCTLRSSTMDLDTAIMESKQAIHYFFNNDFDRARKILEPWANSSMYHSLGNSVFAFLESILTFEQVGVVCECIFRLLNVLFLGREKSRRGWPEKARVYLGMKRVHRCGWKGYGYGCMTKWIR